MTQLKYTGGLEYQINRKPIPGYMTNVDGSKVSVNSIGAAYAMAETTIDTILLARRADTLYNVAKGLNLSPTGEVMSALKASKLNLYAQVGRQLMTLATLCDHYHLPTTLQSARMARYKTSLSSITQYRVDSNGVEVPSSTIYFRTPDDWRRLAVSINQTILDEQSAELKGTTITMQGSRPITSMQGSGAPSGMGLAVLAAAGSALTGAAEVGTLATLGTALIPIILVVGVVAVVGVCLVGAYVAKLAIDAWTAHDKGVRELEKKRLDEYHQFLTDYVNCDPEATPDKCRRLRESVNQLGEQVNKDIENEAKSITDKLFGDQFGNILAVGGVLIGGYIAYNIVKEISNNKES